MSFDLFFKPRHGAPDVKAIKSYFSGRLHHSAGDRSTTYFNEDTDAVFDIKFDGATGDDEGGFPIQCNINFFRPSYFMLEAEPEVSAFVRTFDLETFNPQAREDRGGDYDADRIVASWSRGNQGAYDIFLSEPGERDRFRLLSTQKIQQAWRWNYYGAQALQAEVGPGKFVPRIWFLEFGSRFGTAMVWPDGAPLVAVPVDWLIVTRYDRHGETAENRPLVDWKTVMEEAGPYVTRGPGDTVAFDFIETPSDLAEFLQALPLGTMARKRWSPASVLDLEMASGVPAGIRSS